MNALKVLEQYTTGKSTTIPSEDAIVVTPYYAAVIDGATPKTKFRYPNEETPGARAARQLTKAVESLPTDIDAYSAFCLLNATLTQPEVEAANRPTASIAIFSKSRNEIWMMGDCQFALLSQGTNGGMEMQCYNNPKRIDKILSQWRSDILHSLLSRGVCNCEEITSNDPGRKIIQPFITQQVRYQNLLSEHPLAYGVLDGTNVPRRFIRQFPVQPEVKQIILATDGYPRLFGTLQESEDELMRLLKVDPLCIGSLLGTKGVKLGNNSYDDRSYLKIEL